MNSNFKELFVRSENNPILTSADWPYPASAVFNAGAVKFNDQVLLLVRVEDKEGYSHLGIAKSKNGETDWEIDPKLLKADVNYNEAKPGLEDARIIWFEEFQIYMITCVSFRYNVGDNPPGISIIRTNDFCDFERVVQPLIPPNKDACLLPRKIQGYFALIHRPIVDGRADIWVSFSKDLKFWGDDRVLLSARYADRSWDSYRVGLGPPPIETSEGWLLIYHGTRVTASGSLYRVGLALLDLETMEVIRRSKGWVLGPQEIYERVGNVDDAIFPCGVVVNNNKLSLYYGAADSVTCLATGNLKDILDHLKHCPDQ